MASKYELASYLSNLATIMTEQDKSGSVNRSATLGREYTRAYDELKSLIDKESPNEARQSNSQQHGIDKDRAGKSSGQSRRGI